MGVWGSPQTVSGCAQGAAGTVAASMVMGERVSKRFSRQGMTELNRLNEEETRPDVLSYRWLYVEVVSSWQSTARGLMLPLLGENKY